MKYSIKIVDKQKVLLLEGKQMGATWVWSAPEDAIVEYALDRAFEMGYAKAQADIRRSLGVKSC